MRVIDHLKVSSAISVPFLFLGHYASGPIGCLLGGVLIDADHLLDYYLNFKIPLNRNGFFNWRLVKSLLLDSPLKVGRMLRPIKRIPDGPTRSFVLLHSVELWIAVLLSDAGNNTLIFPIAVGAIGHIIADYLTWNRPWYAFSFFYRGFQGFYLDEVQKYKDRMKAAGMEIYICKDCGVSGIHEVHYEPVNGDFRKGPIENFMVLCPECHDLRHERHAKGR